MANPHRPGNEPSEELKRELDAHVLDDELHPDDRMAADQFLADLRTKFEPLPPK